MPFTPQTWVDGVSGGTELDAEALNRIEQGIVDAHDALELLAEADHTHTSSDITDATSASTPNTAVLRDSGGGFQAAYITGLSTATGNTQAIPKSQLDSAIADRAASVHTHVAADITDATATGLDLVTATDATAGRLALDVLSAAEITTQVDLAQGEAETYADTGDAAVTVAQEAYTDAAVDYSPIHLAFAVGTIPTRPDTSETNRPVYWAGPAAASLPTNGTTAGGTAAAAPGDLVFEH